MIIVITVPLVILLLWAQLRLELIYGSMVSATHTPMKALKCKTLGGIHMQSTAAMELCTYIIYTSVVYILRMRVRVPRCPE